VTTSAAGAESRTATNTLSDTSFLVSISNSHASSLKPIVVVEVDFLQ
jgi:hypothetical protein